MGKRVRAYVRSRDARADALSERGVSIAVADFTNIGAAMDGARFAYFLHPVESGILAAAAYFAQAAKDAGLRQS